MSSTKNSNILIGYFRVPAAGASYRIEQYCQRDRSQTGFGVATNFGGPEIYTQVTIKKHI